MKNVMLSLSFVLSSLVASVVSHPMHQHRRALKIVTVTSEVVSIVYVTSTSYVDELPPATTTVESTPVFIAAPTTTSVPIVVVVPSSTSKNPVSTPLPAPTPTSTTEVPQVFVAPPSSTSVAVIVPATTEAPAPTTTTEVPSTPTVATPEAVVAASSSSSSSGSGVGDHSGDGTFYATGLGSCGITNSDTDMIAALSFKTMDLTLGANPNNNPMCGRKVKAYSKTNTEGVIVTIVDTCAGCAGASDLDFSPAAFDKLGLEAQGRIPITWEFVN